MNGLPLAFIEVKKPNNHDGIKAERDRMNSRLANPRFKKFINITQLLVFSNNMEYDNSGLNSLAGAFYATPVNDGNIGFNYFREEHEFDLHALLKPVDSIDEDFLLKDNNQQVVKYNPEFLTNKSPNTPTNRIITSLLSRERFKFLLQFGIVYLDDPETGIEKHIMRYPQVFATMAIEKKLNEGINRGVIWHTQGSGKTALAYFNTRFLTHYYQKKGIIPKFYFIVDRLDLLTQASSEFVKRGLEVRNVNSREDFTREFSETKAVHGSSGKPEITVVNIQKFQDDTKVMQAPDYDVSVQRVYFLDEAHRSYDPKGSFLSNLYESDRDAVKIALTGTPLIVPDSDNENQKVDVKTTRNIFGDYIHKYYYNASIKDGYTLRLIREGIESNYRMGLNKIMDELVQHGEISKSDVLKHPRFVNEMLRYIITDFQDSRVRFGDKQIGAMVVCDSADQAREMYRQFEERYSYQAENPKPLRGALILHDEGTKDDRRDEVKRFKKGQGQEQVDILFVYNMLLTGFDASRLKKLYLGRIIKAHNLLQTLTRVNRPYKKFKYGFVVDFANITKEFDITNRAYFDELNREYEDSLDAGETGEDVFGSLFKSREEMEAELQEVREQLFSYDLQNAEIFSRQMSEIDDRKKLNEIVRLLASVRGLYNVAKLIGHYDILDKIDFTQMARLLREAQHRLDLLNAKASLERGDEAQNILNSALEEVMFTFKKVSEEELKLADELKDIVRRTRTGLGGNFDPEDPYYQSLYEEFKHLFEKANMKEQSQDDMRNNMQAFEKLLREIKELNRQNENLRQKYSGDAKFARIHKRIRERGEVSQSDIDIYNILVSAKNGIDDKVTKSEHIVDNSGYFNDLVAQQLAESFHHANINTSYDALDHTKNQIMKEYEKEYDYVGA